VAFSDLYLGSSPTRKARKYIERAAYLAFTPAQYKLGHAYEYAVPPFPFDLILSFSTTAVSCDPDVESILNVSLVSHPSKVKPELIWHCPSGSFVVQNAHLRRMKLLEIAFAEKAACRFANSSLISPLHKPRRRGFIAHGNTYRSVDILIGLP